MYAEHASQAEERPPLLLRALSAWRPYGGWPLLLLTWAAVLSLPAAALNGQLVVGLTPTVWLASLGLFIAWWLADRQLSGPAATAILFLAGVLADLILGVWVVRFGPLLAQLWRWLAWATGARSLPAPEFTYLRQQAEALALYAQRVAWWVDGLISGRGAPDNLVVIGLAGLLAWGLAAWAGWWVARRGQPFLALLPTAALLAPLVYWSQEARWSLVIFLGAATMLLVMARLTHLMHGWDREGVDYSPEIRLDAALTGAALTCLVLILAPTLPSLTSPELSQAFWRRFAAPYREVEQSVARSFASVQPARSLVPASGAAPGGMPRSHLLGGRPELGQEVALRAQVRGAQPGEKLYWRGQTFAYYTGRGWTDPSEDVIELRLAAGEPWMAAGPDPGGRPLINQVEVLAGSRAVLYAAGEPVAADRPYQAWLRAPDELIALSAPDGPRRYTVLSQAFVPDPARLRQVGAVAPSGVISSYLQLPASGAMAGPGAIDPRLVDLAADWAAGAATPYDRALAIESALRQLPYSLDVPAPPAGREVASWFLFDLRRGYCDYFATAMVVMARLQGIPARLAIGYAAGSYDAALDTYIVTELSAHSWPELFFPDLGWMRFEPTPSLPASLQPELPAISPDSLGAAAAEWAPSDVEAGIAELRRLAEVNQAERRRQLAVRRLLAALNGLALSAWWIGQHFSRRGVQLANSGDPALALSFHRLARWGARLGRPLRAGETPQEYAAGLADQAARVAGRARWQPARARAAAQIIRSGGARLAEAYTRALFAPGAAAPAPQRLPQPWASLRRLWLARWFLQFARRFPKNGA